MSLLPELQINTRIEIEVDDPEFSGKYFSRVMDITRKDLRILSPATQGVPIPLRTNTRIRISYVGERAMYSFHTIIKQKFQDVMAGLVVELPKRVDRVQRREYVRLDTQINFRFRVRDEEGLNLPNPNKLKKSYIADISGGGVRFYTEEAIEEDSLLELQLAIDGIEQDIIAGKVVRCRERVEGGFEIGVAFEALSPVVQDRIISWIFLKQADYRRKGLA